MGYQQLDFLLFPSALGQSALSLLCGERDKAKLGAEDSSFWWPSCGELWRNCPTSFPTLQMVLKGLLDEGSVEKTCFRFGNARSVLLTGELEGTDVRELVMRVALIPGLLPPLENLFDVMLTHAASGFCIGAELHDKFHVSGLTAHSQIICDFENRQFFNELVTSSRAWQLCESLWLEGDVERTS